MELHPIPASAPAPAHTTKMTPVAISPNTVRAWREAGRFGMSGCDMQVLMRLVDLVEMRGGITLLMPVAVIEGGAA